MAEENNPVPVPSPVPVPNPVPASVLDMKGPFFGTLPSSVTEVPELKLENALTNLDIPGLQSYFKENPATWQELGYAPSNVSNVEVGKTYKNPNSALARFVYEEILEEPPGSYEFMFGAEGQRPMSPEAALGVMSQYRNVSGSQAFKEQLPRYVGTGLVGLGTGVGITVLGGPALVAGTGALLTTLASDAGFRIFSPDSPINKPYVPGTPGETGEYIAAITGGSAPFLATPWAIPQKTKVSLGTATLARNLERWSMFKDSKLPARLIDFDRKYVETMSGARKAPNTFLAREGSNIATATLAGGSVQEFAPEEMGGFKTALQFGAELFTPTFVRPTDYLIKGVEGISNRLSSLVGIASKQLGRKQQIQNFVDTLAPAMLEAQNIEDPVEAQQYLVGVLQELRKSQSGGVQTLPETTALATDDPVLRILEARLVGKNPNITGKYREVATQRNDILRELSALVNENPGDAGPLALRAEFLLQAQEDVVWQNMVSSLNKFEEARTKLTAAGDDFDEGVLFQDFFLGEQGLLADIQRQRTLLRGQIPKNEIIQPETLSFLTDTFDQIRETFQVGDQAIRFSYGQDLVSIDKAIQGLKKRINPEAGPDVDLDSLNLEISKAQENLARTEQDLTKAREKPEAERTDLEKSTFNKLFLQRRSDESKVSDLMDQRREQTNPSATVEEEVTTTTKELIFLLDTIDRATRSSIQGGSSNPILTQNLAELKNVTLDVLRIAEDERLALGGGSTNTGLALQDYLSFEEASGRVAATAFLSDISKGKVSYERSASEFFGATQNSVAVRLTQLDEAVNLLNSFNAEQSGRPAQSIQDAAAAREESLNQLPPTQRAYVEQVEDSIDRGIPSDEGVTSESGPVATARLMQGSDRSKLTAGQIQRLEDLTNNPEDSQLELRSIERRLLKGFLNNKQFFSRTPRVGRDGQPLTQEVDMVGDDGNVIKVNEPVYDYEPTQQFNDFIRENEKPLKEYFPSIYADMLNVNALSDTLNVARGAIATKELARNNAFMRHMMVLAEDNNIPSFREPNALINSILGEPGQDSKIQRTDAPKDFRLVIRAMMDGAEDNQLIAEGFVQGIYNNAFIRSGGTATGKDVDPEAFFDYLFEPINGVQTRRSDTGRVPSVMNILVDEGLITEAERLSIRRTVQALKQIKQQEQGAQARFSEFGGKTAEEIEAADGNLQKVRKAGTSVAANMLLSVGGSAIGTTLYGLLTGGVGGPGVLRSASAGSTYLKDLFQRLPLAAQDRLFVDLFQNPEMMANALELYNNPGKLDELLVGKKLNTLYSWFQGAGANIAREEFFAGFDKTAPEVRREEREEAGAAPMVPSRPNPRRVQPSIVPPPEPVTPPPQAAAPRPMPPPVAQAPAPTAQAPASPNQRARYAAMFPNDTASDLIRQGIGSLS
jgi:hypothetical protein